MAKLFGSALSLVLIVASAFALTSTWGDRRLGPIDMVALVVLSVAAALFALTLVAGRTRFSELALNLWFSTGIFGGTFIAADLLLGVFLIEPLSPPMVSDPYAHHTLEPNTQSRFATADFTYTQQVNSLGLRGAEVELRKSPGTYRIVMLGDSFTMGKGVEDDSTFSAMLERSMSQGNLPVEVLNAGVDSYSPLLAYFRLTKTLPDLDPDLVVLNFDMSDLVQDALYRSEADRSSDGTIVAVPGPSNADPDAAERARDFVVNRLPLTRLLLWRTEAWAARATGQTNAALLSSADPDVLLHTLEGDTEDREEQWSGVFESILSLRDYCERNGIFFALTAYPWGHQVSDEAWRPGRELFIEGGVVVSDNSVTILQQFANSEEIPFLDVFGAFRSFNGRAPLYFSYDMHWTPAGHRLMAQEVESFIRGRFLSR